MQLVCVCVCVRECMQFDACKRSNTAGRAATGGAHEAHAARMRAPF